VFLWTCMWWAAPRPEAFLRADKLQDKIDDGKASKRPTEVRLKRKWSSTSSRTDGGEVPGIDSLQFGNEWIRT
jgi:hypothetical protein